MAARQEDEEGSLSNSKVKFSKETSVLCLKTSSINFVSDLRKVFNDIKDLKWKKIKAENLDLSYTLLLQSDVATILFDNFEEDFEYFTGELSKVKVFGKWHDLPRKQVTFGDEGLTYKYSGIVTRARPWPPSVAALKDLILRITGHNYNFVLVNRYKDGLDRIGEHKDDEKELDKNVPIASVSLGQERDFYFKHQDVRAGSNKRSIKKVVLKLEHGSLLLMNPPTNRFWYHSLPQRKNLQKPRINLTFRRIIPKGSK